MSTAAKKREFDVRDAFGVSASRKHPALDPPPFDVFAASSSLWVPQGLQRLLPIQVRVGELVAVASQAAVAARVAAARVPRTRCRAKCRASHRQHAGILLNLRHQPGAARHRCRTTRSPDSPELPTPVIVTFKSVLGTSSASDAPKRTAYPSGVGVPFVRSTPGNFKPHHVRHQLVAERKRTPCARAYLSMWNPTPSDLRSLLRPCRVHAHRTTGRCRNPDRFLPSHRESLASPASPCVTSNAEDCLAFQGLPIAHG